ncbi:DUF4249 domain-containing protein [Mucilaginibacter agri]|uniref:DUF4249 family protein n=1 Tax=Mucilaginibacter agri TaxID=2695265 RepID=A0A966DS36_9SPHI|nr:DUF4249 domain-containing protein [Mucilaginibacter agri]NCD69160.1 DUF4249 family protein [Mucilaginibacter agri]
MKRRGILTGLFITLTTMWGCKKPFTPEVINKPSNYLVVEGTLNTGGDTTTLKLSRTTQLNDTAKTQAENGAALYVEDNNNIRYSFIPESKGVYKAQLILQGSKTCTLHITTKDQQQYASDVIPVLTTPPIDSLQFTVLSNGLQFYTSTHDPTNTVKYYRWDYDETWEYVSFYQSRLKYVNDQIQYRDLATEDIYRCWAQAPALAIVVASTAGLSQSVINNEPVGYVDISSGKLAHGYSLLLKQYSLTKEAYEYWQKLKKNTEQLGSIFDAQPSDLKGNMHNVANSDEPVLGFVSASGITTKRILFDPTNLTLPGTSYFPPPYADECGKAFIPLDPTDSFDTRAHNKFSKGDSLLIEVEERKPDGKLIGYNYAQANCVDCRLKIKNGTNKRPSYWPGYL